MTGERTRYYSIRPRRIPPEFCTDELLESCSPLAALLLYRLMSQADDQGRLPGHPKHVKGVCFPMRPELTERRVGWAIDELRTAGFVIRYDAQGRVFLQIDRWFDLQGKWGQRRTYASRYPAPPGWTNDWVNAGAEVRALDAQDVRDVPPPLPSTPPSSIGSTTPDLGKPAASAAGLKRLDELLEKAKRGRLTEEEAFELGTAIAGDAQVGEKVR